MAFFQKRSRPPPPRYRRSFSSGHFVHLILCAAANVVPPPGNTLRSGAVLRPVYPRSPPTSHSRGLPACVPCPSAIAPSCRSRRVARPLPPICSRSMPRTNGIPLDEVIVHLARLAGVYLDEPPVGERKTPTS
jgi:hypothetical protein